MPPTAAYTGDKNNLINKYFFIKNNFNSRYLANDINSQLKSFRHIQFQTAAYVWLLPELNP